MLQSPWSLLPLVLIAPTVCMAQAPPPITLAENFSDQPLTDYWASEKLDGVRAYWDGSQLWTRSGNLIRTPVDFTQGFPKHPMDGELWAGRGKFEVISALIHRSQPDPVSWQDIRYMVFDWPEPLLRFANRYQELKRQVKAAQLAQLEHINMWEPTSTNELQAQLTQFDKDGAEGIVLHNYLSFYLPGRSSNQLKLKRYQDAEARVVGYTSGQGKYQDLIGSLIVETEQGIQFKIGSGLSDADRHQPPLIGSQVTYRFNGLTSHGRPRFARFIRRFTPI